MVEKMCFLNHSWLSVDEYNDVYSSGGKFEKAEKYYEDWDFDEWEKNVRHELGALIGTYLAYFKDCGLKANMIITSSSEEDYVLPEWAQKAGKLAVAELIKARIQGWNPDYEIPFSIETNSGPISQKIGTYEKARNITDLPPLVVQFIRAMELELLVNSVETKTLASLEKYTLLTLYGTEMFGKGTGWKLQDLLTPDKNSFLNAINSLQEQIDDWRKYLEEETEIFIPKTILLNNTPANFLWSNAKFFISKKYKDNEDDIEYRVDGTLIYEDEFQKTMMLETLDESVVPQDFVESIINRETFTLNLGSHQLVAGDYVNRIEWLEKNALQDTNITTNANDITLIEDDIMVLENKTDLLNEDNGFYYNGEIISSKILLSYAGSDFNMNGYRITGLLTAINPQDATTLFQVEALVQDLDDSLEAKVKAFMSPHSPYNNGAIISETFNKKIAKFKKDLDLQKLDFKIKKKLIREYEDKMLKYLENIPSTYDTIGEVKSGETGWATLIEDLQDYRFIVFDFKTDRLTSGGRRVSIGSEMINTDKFVPRTREQEGRYTLPANFWGAEGEMELWISPSGNGRIYFKPEGFGFSWVQIWFLFKK